MLLTLPLLLAFQPTTVGLRPNVYYLLRPFCDMFGMKITTQIYKGMEFCPCRSPPPAFLLAVLGMPLLRVGRFLCKGIWWTLYRPCTNHTQYRLGPLAATQCLVCSAAVSCWLFNALTSNVRFFKTFSLLSILACLSHLRYFVVQG